MTKTSDIGESKPESATPYNTQPQYSYQQVFDASLEYFGGDGMAASTFANKYALRTGDDIPEPYCELTPADMHDRLASEFARIEARYPNPRGMKEIRDALEGFARIVPQGSPMYGIGNTFSIVSLSNCVVIASPTDDVSGIFDTGKQMANLYKRRCGVGLSLDTLRPDGMPVKNAAKYSTGAWSYAGFYSYITCMIGQAGRRGALMETMCMRHPDIHRFASMKQDLDRVTGANVSVMLDDEFMSCALRGGTWYTRWSRDDQVEMSDAKMTAVLAQPGEWVAESFECSVLRDHDEPHPPLASWRWQAVDPVVNRQVFIRKFQAEELWQFICRCARNTAEPGLLFWDNYGRELPANYYPEFKSVSTNPCSEISLSAFDSCRLITINLTGYVRNPFAEDASFDYEAFANDAKLAMRLNDDLVDLEIECLQLIIGSVDNQDEKELWGKLLQAAIKGRRTGLGTHGLGDTLARLRLRYDSDEALREVEVIYSVLRNNAYAESVNLANERGAFPAFDWEVEKTCPFTGRLPEKLRAEMSVAGRRNISILTNAPTGSCSVLSQTSSGIEPTFRHFYIRRKKVNPTDEGARVDFKDATGDSWQHFEMFERNLREYFEYDPMVKAKWEEVFAQSPHKDFERNLEFWSDQLEQILPPFFVHAAQIDPLQRVRLQGALQATIDHGVSSTINLPEDINTDTVRGIYEESWRVGLKGITVYRDNCRNGVLVTGTAGKASGIAYTTAPKRPAEMECDIHRTIVDGQKWTIFVGMLDGKPYEVFGGLSESVEIPRRIVSGKIVKRKCDKEQANGRKSCYDLVTGEDDDQMTVRDVATAFNDGIYAWATRQLSLSLRHGVAPKFIVEQLKRSPASHLHDFSRAMGRVLGKYVSDGGTVDGEKPDFCKSGNCE